jgi:DNA-binding beta-propeller fold protein YncE
MKTSTHTLARKPSRRDFFHSMGAALAATAFFPRSLQATSHSATQSQPIILGAGHHRYLWIQNWAKLPEGMKFGNTHGAVVIDSQGRVLMNTDSDNAIIIFSPDGKFIKAWGKEWRNGTHGMALHKEGKTEFLYLTHFNRHQFAKCTLDGEVVWVKDYPKESGVYQKADEFKPTGIAFAPNGEFYVTDGYGKSYVHQYNNSGVYVRSWGGSGTEAGKLKQPHGIWVDTREKTPRVLVADRANHRLQFFSLDGNFLSMVTEDLRLPSNFHQRGQDIVIADLQGRVTIVDRLNKVITHLGDNEDASLRGQNPVPPDKWKDGQFISPHCVRWDSSGNLYVAEWLSTGRITKLKRLK